MAERGHVSFMNSAGCTALLRSGTRTGFSPGNWSSANPGMVGGFDIFICSICFVRFNCSICFICFTCFIRFHGVDRGRWVGFCFRRAPRWRWRLAQHVFFERREESHFLFDAPRADRANAREKRTFLRSLSVTRNKAGNPVRDPGLEPSMPHLRLPR